MVRHETVEEIMIKYRHYFFEISPFDLIAFFEWDGVEPMKKKEHGKPVGGPFGFDHVSFGVETEDDLWELKDRSRRINGPGLNTRLLPGTGLFTRVRVVNFFTGIVSVVKTDRDEWIIALMNEKVHRKGLSAEGRRIIILSSYYSTPLFLLEKINYNLHYNDVDLWGRFVPRCLVLESYPAN